MASANFIDKVTIRLRSGKGGAGSVHFRRERYIPKGGPDGGNGGRGGDIFLEANPQLNTLLHLRYTRHITAEDGKAGQENLRSGKDGADITIPVPLGTVAEAEEEDAPRVEITEPGQRVRLLQGGCGGKGNTHFATSTKQTPRHAQPGEPAQELTLTLTLKIIADVGIIGPPNAGKSTLLSVMSAAKPRIASYTFTTLTPQVGVVAYDKMTTFVMAEIPGLIQGAAQGKGLGMRFLQHAERNKFFLTLIPADLEDIAATYDQLYHELTQYSRDFADKPHLLAISKADLLDQEARLACQQALPPQLPLLFISAHTSEGLAELKSQLWHKLQSLSTDMPSSS